MTSKGFLTLLTLTLVMGIKAEAATVAVPKQLTLKTVTSNHSPVPVTYHTAPQTTAMYSTRKQADGTVGLVFQSTPVSPIEEKLAMLASQLDALKAVPVEERDSQFPAKLQHLKKEIDALKNLDTDLSKRSKELLKGVTEVAQDIEFDPKFGDVEAHARKASLLKLLQTARRKLLSGADVSDMFFSEDSRKAMGTASYVAGLTELGRKLQMLAPLLKQGKIPEPSFYAASVGILPVLKTTR